MKPVIYADTLFLFNFLMNTLILIITAKFIHIKIGCLRLGAAAALGAVYSVLMFFPQYEVLYTLIIKAAVLFGIEYLAFGGKGIWRIVKNFLVFILVNVALGGTVTALIFLTDFGTAVGSVVTHGGIYMNMSPFVLIFALAGTYLLLGVYQNMSKRKLLQKSLLQRVVIDYKGKTAEANIFADTGCFLCDPVTDAPAMVVEYKTVKWLLSEAEQKIIENGEDVTKAYENGLRVLPFSTLGGDNMIFGIVADISGEHIKRNKVTVGITTDKKFGENYSGIVNPEMLLQEEEMEAVV